MSLRSLQNYDCRNYWWKGEKNRVASYRTTSNTADLLVTCHKSNSTKTYVIRQRKVVQHILKWLSESNWNAKRIELEDSPAKGRTMSSQAQGEGVETPKRRGLGRYVQRMRTVLRTGTRHPRESAGAVAPTGRLVNLPKTINVGGLWTQSFAFFLLSRISMLNIPNERCLTDFNV